MDTAPIYTRENCQFAFPLQWGLTLFWRAAQFQAHWLEQLADALESDGIRILSHRFVDSVTSQFAISTKPHVSPQTIVQRVKGRLQYLVRDAQPKPFQRNFALRSFGSEQRAKIEAYVATQTDHHRCADPRFQALLESIQIVDSNVDLAKDCRSSHGLYWYNLHVVLVNQERWRQGNEKMLLKIRNSIPRIAQKWNCRVSRAGILPDHIHIALGCSHEVAPDEVALSFLNNFAYLYGMKPIFQFGAYVGKFGEYDQRVVHGTEAKR
jgi:REP element-mobilizing transposase RayT